MDKFSYSLGTVLAHNLKKQDITEFNASDLAKGIEDVIKGSPLVVDPAEANQLIQNHLKAIAQAKHGKNLEEGAAFLAKNGERSEVTTLPSGLQYEVLKASEGPKPLATDKVTTHYHGTLIDGSVFDSSVQRGQPATFPVNGVIAGWVEALQLMSVGSKWRLYVPHNLAYGEQAAGEMIKPYSTLIFDVELIQIN